MVQKYTKNNREKYAVYVLVAGGTGGHLFPALSVAKILKKSAGKVYLFTDERVKDIVDDQYIDKVFISNFKKSLFNTQKPKWKLFSKWLNISFTVRLFFCGMKSLFLFLKQRPNVVVGFGGYPSAPTVLAAKFLRIPYVLHECNSILGRTNKILANNAAVITTGFEKIKGIPNQVKSKQVFTGNPIRESIAKLHFRKYIPPTTSINVFVIGGSQGSELLSNIVPSAIHIVSQKAIHIKVKMQAKEKDCARLSEQFEKIGIECTVQPFFKNIATELRWSHIVISRAGAITLAEIAAAGIPSILIPLSCSLDGDQMNNANDYANSGAAILIKEADLSVTQLGDTLLRLCTEQDLLIKLSESVLKKFVPHAATQLAYEIMGII